MKVDEKLEAMAKVRLTPHIAYPLVRYSDLNPEQKLAYVLLQLVELKKETLLLMEVCKVVAEEYKQWKDTPEGKAWCGKKAAERVAKAASTDAAK